MWWIGLWRIDAFDLWCWRRLLRVPWIQLVHPKGDQSWVFIGRTDVEAETPILWPSDATSWLTWKRPWCWERLKAGGEGDHRGWSGWMASLTRWTWVWVSSGSWWWTGKSGVLQSMGSQRAGHDWATELNWSYLDTGTWGHLVHRQPRSVSTFSFLEQLLFSW